MNNLKMIDLFAGTGAFSHVGKKYNVSCIYANDFSKNSKSIYDINNEHKLDFNDINKVDIDNIGNHDILCGGFPCQPFSIAGKKLGFDDERANVFWKILKIIAKYKPSVVILENVKNLQTHNNKQTFNTILDELKKLKYHIKYKILNTCKITTIPQNRERIYIVCFKSKKHYNKFSLDFKDKKNKNINDFLETNIEEKYYYTNKLKVYNTISTAITKNINTNTVYQYRRHYVRENKNNVCPTLTANMGSGGHNVPIIKDNKGIRKLTPRECFNLQGFPNTYNLPQISDSRLYHLAGNAVSVPIVELIFNELSTLNW